MHFCLAALSYFAFSIDGRTQRNLLVWASSQLLAQLLGNSLVFHMCPLLYALCAIYLLGPLQPMWVEFSSRSVPKVRVVNSYSCYVKYMGWNYLSKPRHIIGMKNYPCNNRHPRVGGSCRSIDYPYSLRALSYVTGVLILWIWTLAWKRESRLDIHRWGKDI